PADRGVAVVDLGTEGQAWAAHHGGAHRHPGHHLDPGGDDDVVHAGHDALGGEVGRLLRGAALPVDGGAHHRLGEAGGQGGVAPDVERLLADLHHAAHDHVLHEGGIEVVAADEGPEGLRGEINRVRVLQLAVPATNGRPDGVDDDGGRHVSAPIVVLDRSVKKPC